ncbi:hypothetical protein ACFOGJ_11670 [Marinibaculum pumilum]|uniref:Uncharacterized protein n=1 Tax=Marinibaculum pumilum TaxID=1766165 RepID=A0ABV7L0D1_9PROT
MADDSEPTISGFDEVSVGYSYIQLSLTILDLSAGMSAELSVNAGFTFTVTIGGDYSTSFGPAFDGTAWLAGIANLEYNSAGSTEVTIDGNPITLKSAVAESGGAAAKLHAAGARVLTAGVRAGQALGRATARASRTSTAGSRNSVGGNVSTGGQE